MSGFIPVPDVDYYDKAWDDQYKKGLQAKYNNRYLKVHQYLVESLTANDIVLEVGCGMGHFAGNYVAPTCLSFLATDISSVAIDIARKTFPSIADQFQVFDALSKSFLRTDLTKYYHLLSFCKFNTIVALEFLEHIDKDIEFLTSIESGIKLILSLPLNEKQRKGYPPGTPRGYPTHRRIYTEASIHECYGKLIDIRLMKPIQRKPALWMAVVGYKK